MTEMTQIVSVQYPPLSFTSRICIYTCERRMDTEQQRSVSVNTRSLPYV